VATEAGYVTISGPKFAGGSPNNPQDQRQPPEFPGRRSFLVVLIGLGAAVVGALLSVPLVMYAVDPLFRKTSPKSYSDAGPISQFDHLTQPAEPVIPVTRTDGWRVITSQEPIYVLPPDVGQHRVLSTVCPHLGCEVEWRDGEKRFYCPCHGSVFAEDGTLISGPAPRGMDYLDSKVSDGRLQVEYEYFRMLVPDREVME
jgi:menaquinol-cytochrome c reductase iron-sulfur subunit